MTVSETEQQTALAADDPAGYKSTEIGVLPEEWGVVALEDVASFVMGQSPPSETYNSEGIGLPFLQGKAEFGDVYTQPVKWCSAPVKTSPQGAILISVRAPVGDVNIASSKCCIGRGLAAVLQKPEVDNGFLFFYLQVSKDRFEKESSGSTFKSINKNVLKRFLLPLPSLPEQHAIASVLRTVQEAKEATEQVIVSARELKRSLMNHLFTYGPVPVEEADHVPLKETETGRTPEHWETVELSEVAEVKISTSKLPGIELEPIEREDSQILVLSLKVSDMNLPSNSKYMLQATLHTFVDADKMRRLSLVPPGAVVLPKRGAAIATNKKRIMAAFGILDPNLLAVVPDPNLDSGFLFNWFEKLDLRKITDQTTIPQLNKKDIEPLLMSFPLLSEQKKIASTLEGIDAKIAAEENRKRTLDILFKTLLSDLMTGKLRVEDLDLTEIEHASG